MKESSKRITLNEAAGIFLGNLPAGDMAVGQQIINQFVRWFGRDRKMDILTASEVSNYTKKLSSTDTDYHKKIELLRAFLTSAKKEGWTGKNLSVNMKIKKTTASKPAVCGKKKETIDMTREGYENVKKELESLKKQRPQIVEEISKAAEDKDFRENAPLHAAKERLGHLEGRIMEIEEALKMAKVIGEEKAAAHKIRTGDCVVLYDMSSGEEMRYTIVSPREVNPAKGRISNASPIGKAVIGMESGIQVEIEAPAGKLCLRIERIEK